MSGSTARITFRYTIYSSSNYFDGYTSTSPTWAFSINGSQKGSGSKSGMAGNYVEEQLCSYYIDLTASNGTFATTSCSGAWTGIGYGWPPNSLTISASDISLPKISGATESYYYNGSTWTRLNAQEIYGYDGTK